MLENILTVVGAIAGIISGYLIGKNWGYYSLNQQNTSGDFDNPELYDIDEIKKRNTMKGGDTVGVVFFMLIAFAFGAFFIMTGLDMQGAIEAGIATSPNVNVNATPGTLYCVGGFAIALGGLMFWGLITGNVHKG